MDENVEKDKNSLWEGKQSQKGQRKKKVRESSMYGGRRGTVRLRSTNKLRL